ncbi:hypothetical protein GCM10010954_27200 [Halobacillus andaensis]|uniref:beta-fructofuranosidase n=1 Tax=Halobacillus andaensis TaxID=1176239 RepID=A0A917EZE9_HALAA|nr:GH32 C-terminal domain-containing protein [Halobacillus andaensis]MBP2005694.1 sucrose-6-phosphate hydrolase SacC (GH32 family) [Halobacillus andaensis]GGF26719.1 hypothetical protein GCM10010954_27200 [Halobacillus andaensis]
MNWKNFSKVSSFLVVLTGMTLSPNVVSAENEVEAEISSWSFEEGEGAATLDEASGIEDKIEYVFNEAEDKDDSNPMWREGIKNNALLFDGYSTWIERPADEWGELGSSFTVEGWVAPRSYEWGGDDKVSAILSQLNAGEGKGFVFGMGRHGSLEMKAAFEGEEVRATTESSLEKHEWSHVAGVISDERGVIEVYINGEKEAEASIPEGKTFTQADQPLLLGKHSDPSIVNGTFDANMFAGLMDEVQVERGELTPEDIKAFYQDVMASLPSEGLPAADTDYDRSRYDGDRHRAQYHMTAPEHWMNEPHSPIYFEGKYHLFYQHNPQGPYWRQIHWGHVVSDDLMHWDDALVALAPEKDSVAPDGVWSGDSTYDENGEPVLLFTAGDDSRHPNQSVGLARSTFSEDGDPLLPNWEMEDELVTVQEEDLEVEEGEVMFGQFRDPFVWEEDGTWYQLVSSGIKDGDQNIGGTALLYSSENLTDWDYEGPFFTGDKEAFPATGDVWELPVFLPLKDENGDDTGKYAFFINPWFEEYSPHDVKYVWHWIGEWDKENNKFVPDHDEPRLFDYGEHLTGPSGFVDDKDRSVLFSITQDRRSEQDHYDAGWAHNAGLPLELTLQENGMLGIQPIKETENVRGEKLISESDTTVKKLNRQLEKVNGDTLEVNLTVDPKDAEQFGLHFRESTDSKEVTSLFYNVNEQQLKIDRNHSSLDPDAEKGIHGGDVELKDGLLHLQLFLDRSMVEAYANDTHSITSRVYPTLGDADGISMTEEGGKVSIESFELWNMGSAYGELVEADEPENSDEKDNTPVKTLPNHDFQTGDLSGWIVEEGEAFSDDHVRTDEDWGWGGPFNQAVNAHDPEGFHYWGFHAEHGGDGAVGVMRSEDFILGGDGTIDFLVGGGNDEENLSVALIRKNDNHELARTTGGNNEAYRRVEWNMEEHVGEELFLRVTDNATGGFGHINLDNVNVPVDLDTEFEEEDLSIKPESSSHAKGKAIGHEKNPNDHRAKGKE